MGSSGRDRRKCFSFPLMPWFPPETPSNNFLPLPVFVTFTYMGVCVWVCQEEELVCQEKIMMDTLHLTLSDEGGWNGSHSRCQRMRRELPEGGGAEDSQASIPDFMEMFWGTCPGANPRGGAPQGTRPYDEQEMPLPPNHPWESPEGEGQVEGPL